MRESHADTTNGSNTPAPALLTAWSAVSPIGVGSALFAAAARDACPVVVPLERANWPVPQRLGGLVPDFDQREVLGHKGTRSMDRITGLAVSTVGLLLDTGGSATWGASLDRDRIGLVLGTGAGSAQSIMDFTRDSLTQDKPFYVDPARFPNTVINCAAGQSAIWHGLRGPNTTISGGRPTGLLALNYALRLQRGGHADAVLWGAVEEMSVQRSWLEWHSRDESERDDPLGEGCVMFLLEPATAPDARRRSLAQVLAVEFAAFGADDAEDALTRCVRSARHRAGADGEVWGVSYSGDSREERDAVKSALDGAAARTVRAHEVFGDVGAASAAFQLAALLAVARGERSATDRIGLVTSLDHGSALAAALVVRFT